MKIMTVLLVSLSVLPLQAAAEEPKTLCEAAGRLAEWVYRASRDGQNLSEYVAITRNDPRYSPHQKAYFEAILLDVWPDAHNMTLAQARTRGEVMCFKTFKEPMEPQ